MNCIECDKKVKNKSILNIYLCSNCKNLNKYELVTKTTAKNTYKLDDDDLNELHPFYGNSSYGPATYFKKNEVVNKSCIKFNTTQEYLLETIDDIIKMKKINKEKNKKIRENKRKNKLIAKLNEAGLELREDSKLCKLYIENKTDFTLKEVVERMSQMKYLYEYCHMNECYNQARNEYFEELNNGYFPDVPIFDNAEMIALKKYSNNKYPKIFPWQIKDIDV